MTKPCDPTMIELQKVTNTLKDNIDAVMTCTNVLKNVYDHDDRLSKSMVYNELETVKGKFDSCIDDTEAGLNAVKKIIILLEDSRENVMRTN